MARTFSEIQDDNHLLTTTDHGSVSGNEKALSKGRLKAKSSLMKLAGCSPA